MRVHELDRHALNVLHEAAIAGLVGHVVRVAWDGGLKVKIDEGAWSPPLTDDDHDRADVPDTVGAALARLSKRGELT